MTNDSSKSSGNSCESTTDDVDVYVIAIVFDALVNCASGAVESMTADDSDVSSILTMFGMAAGMIASDVVVDAIASVSVLLSSS